VSGQSYAAGVIFSFLTMLVAIPSAIKVFNWVATLYKGSIAFETPLLFAMSFIFLFTIGGLSGMMIGVLSFDVHVHDTYFILGHFHYVIFGGMGMAFFAAIHYWFPKMFGRMYNTKVANTAWLVIFIGFNTLYAPFFVLGWQGMPRRYYDYLPQYHTLQFISTVGSWVLISGLLLLLGNLVRSLKRGEPAPANPWGGTTLEWSVPSPPPVDNFERIPEIRRDPYVFGEAQDQ
jgi:cytochrome c oxidase subunit 1